MTRPTTSQIDAYCAALKAHLLGERAEMRSTLDDEYDWVPFMGQPFLETNEYRIAPAPPKLREVWIHAEDIPGHGVAIAEGRIAGDESFLRNGRKGVHFREVSPSADAEIAELRRNHDALVKALQLIAIVDQGCGGNLTFKEMAESAMSQARAALQEHGAILK
jgi:hypothetical protein